MTGITTLDSSSPAVRHLCSADRRLAQVISMVGAVSYRTGAEDPYSFLVHEIIEQMLSIKAGDRICARLRETCGGEITPGAVSALSAEEIRLAGMSARKAACIKCLTESVVSGRLDLAALAGLSDSDVTKRLTEFRGIGNWTAKMYLIFVLDRQDVLPVEDGTFIQAYRWLYGTGDVSPASVMKRCSPWKPYSSAAARFLYRALDTGLTREPFAFR